jgi:hypothetical protein
MNLLESAKEYKKQGISVISTNNTKRSLFQWKKYQNEIATDDELKQLFSHPKAQGVGCICGKVSSNLEVIDVDCKYGIDFKEYIDAINKINPFIFNKLYITQTKSNGYHIYYRCDKIEGNLKLANRPATAEEFKDNPNIKELVLIETRGEGGYVIAPPTEGYSIFRGRVIQNITVQEREILFTCARSFNQVYDNVKVNVANEGTSFGLKPWDDYNERADIVELLTKHGWTVVETKGERIFFKRPGANSFTSANYHTGKKVFYVFTTSSQFENKGYSPFAVFALLICNNDFKKATIMAADMGYGEKKKIVDKKIADKISLLIDQGYMKDDIIDKLMVEDQIVKDEAKKNVETVILDSKTKIEKFWKVEYNKQNVPKIQIQKYQLERFLSEENFGLYFQNSKSNSFVLIRDKDGFIEEVSSEQIKKFVKDYVMTLPDKFDKKGNGTGISQADLLEVIYKGSDTFFSSSFFEFLQRLEPKILRDTATTCYFPFNNGIVTITKDDIKLVKYADIDGMSIWKSQVNYEHNITIDQEYEPELCEYYRFLRKISGDIDDRLIYAMTLIGYILHSYKDPSKPYAPILAEETDDEAKGGGTGKGIFFKAISKLIPTVSIDGKNFKPDKTFAFQRVGLETKLVVIEDCPKNVEFERYYPTITEGMTIEKKNKDEIFLNFSESPKIAFTTNYSIASNAEHSKRRQRVFEFAPFFNSQNTPMDFFGHKLFDDWDTDEYDRFYNLMFCCVKLYLEFGIKQVDNSVKLRRKQIKLSFGEEFLEYFDELLDRKSSGFFQISDEWKSFLSKNEIEKKEYSMKRFRKGLEVASQILSINIEFSTNRQNNNTKVFKILN